MELRPFPPSPRRRALARQAGLTAASPMLVGGIACATALLAIAMLGPAIARKLGAWVVAATRGESIDPARAVLELAMPTLAAIAIVAALVHIAQARAVWMPRRNVSGAPSVDPARTRHAAFDLLAATIVGAVAFGWLWFVAPRIAALSSVPLAGGLLVTSAAASLAIAWVAIGVADALVRYRDLANALYMTAREKRDDERLAGIDPRWRNYRARVRDVPDLTGATLVILGDDVAVAISWDPVRRPIPIAIATGRGPRATQLLGLARRGRVPIHRDATLARSIDVGAVAERHWPQLADIIAAVKRSN